MNSKVPRPKVCPRKPSSTTTSPPHPTLASSSLQRELLLKSLTSKRYPLHNPKTRTEIIYLSILSDVLSKPRWWEEIRLRKDLGHVKAEALHCLLETKCPHSALVSGDEVCGCKESRTVDFLVEELRWIACHGLVEIHRRPPFYQPSSSEKVVLGKRASSLDTFLLRSEAKATFWPMAPEGVFASDDIIPTKLAQRLREQLKPLEEEALSKGRWHDKKQTTTTSSKTTTSPNQILDIVCPNDYCIEFGKTLYSDTPNAIAGSKILHRSYSPTPPFIPNACSHDQFQWLPTDITIDVRGRVHIESYINNIHPRRHAGLYETIAGMVEAILPMFERAVECYDGCKETRRIRAKYPYAQCFDDFIDERWLWYRTVLLEEGGRERNGQWYREMMEDETSFRRMMWAHRECLIGDVALDPSALMPTFQSYIKKNPTHRAFKTTPCKTSLLHRRLQISVQVKSIRIAPGQEYPGEYQHLEGCNNDCVAAVAIFPYELENISTPTLTFHELYDETRLTCDDFDDEDRIKSTFNISEGDPNIQPTGTTTLPQNRLLLFQNQNPHRLRPMTLLDPTKPGKLTLLLISLHHPTLQLPSTLHVPTQNPEWMLEDLWRVLGNECWVRGLPVLCVKEVLGWVGGTRTGERNEEIARGVLEKYYDCAVKVPVCDVFWGWQEREESDLDATDDEPF
ncbi:hypothetical protein HDU67_010254 [Dinochytrium kinnereticum]|nr:hypothetical protein HDU67_010254 [Dinochytrium kinnereticum]